MHLQHTLAGSGLDHVILVSPGETYAHAVDLAGTLTDNLVLLVAWGRRPGASASEAPDTLEEAVAAFEGGVAWFMRFDFEAWMRVVEAVAETLLQRVCAEIWHWSDGDAGGADELYGRWMHPRASEIELLERYVVTVGISRPALGDPVEAAPEEAGAEPIRVRVAVHDKWQPEPPQLVREARVTEAEARGMDHEALLAEFRRRWDSVVNDLRTLVR